MANCNAGGNVDEGAKFKEYPAPTDKKNWFRFFSGCIDKMLDGIHKNTGTKISVSCYRRESRLFVCDDLCCAAAAVPQGTLFPMLHNTMLAHRGEKVTPCPES